VFVDIVNSFSGRGVTARPWPRHGRAGSSQRCGLSVRYVPIRKLRLVRNATGSASAFSTS
jgi:hypothetical protein